MKSSRNSKTNTVTWAQVALTMVQGIFRIGLRYTGQFIWAVSTLGIAYLLSNAAKAFVGKTTITVLQLLGAISASMNLTIVGSITLSGVTSLLYYLERRAHQRTKQTLLHARTSQRLKPGLSREENSYPDDKPGRDAQMPITVQTVTAVFMTCCVASMWLFVIFKMIPTYRVDVFKQRLEELRVELAEFATNEQVSFNDRAYSLLDYRIAMLIRHAHDMTFFA